MAKREEQPRSCSIRRRGERQPHYAAKNLGRAIWPSGLGCGTRASRPTPARALRRGAKPRRTAPQPAGTPGPVSAARPPPPPPPPLPPPPAVAPPPPPCSPPPGPRLGRALGWAAPTPGPGPGARGGMGLVRLLCEKHAAIATVVLPVSVAGGFVYTWATGASALEGVKSGLTGAAAGGFGGPRLLGSGGAYELLISHFVGWASSVDALL